MDVKKKPEDYMYDSSECEWDDKNVSDYWKSLMDDLDKDLGLKPAKKSFLDKVRSAIKRKK